ncbi:response regulator [Rubritalea spongiae]|uniref:Response regulator n=1 Tax=Rubritalea spongiae TaxID=430797 RepID=A0ABW5E2G5_9BACT
MKETIQIMLVEDHPKYRSIIEMALKHESDMAICGTFGAAEVALRSLQDVQNKVMPNVILLDLNLPGISGLESLPWFRQYLPNTHIIVLSQSDVPEDVFSAIQQGAAGYLLKSSSLNQIKDGIRTVINGGASLDPKVAVYILEQWKRQPAVKKSEKALSERELEILKLLGQGLVKKEIGDKLGIGYGSVATYIRRIYEKLGVVNAPAAIDMAYRKGILPFD